MNGTIRPSGHKRALLLALALLLAPLFGLAATPALAAPSCTTSGTTVTCTFGYTGAAETWIVPANVSSATFDVYGAGPTAYPNGGKGGRVRAVLAVTPGDTYQIRVGGSYGFNGGGDGQGVGGGASDVRSGGFALTDRLLVAGGGGQATYDTTGGAGGYPAGGGGGAVLDATGGGGGSQIGGGAGGIGYAGAISGSAGTLGQGGNGGDYPGPGDGAGGGGGYYGGGGGATTGSTRAAGGGGSSYATPAATNVSYENGVRVGDGLVVISYIQPDTSAPVITPAVSGTLGNNGWYTGDVNVTWSVTDAESAITSQSGCATQTVSGDTSGTTFTCTATSAGGTSSQSVTIKRDATAPTISYTSRTAPNAAGWNNGPVTVNWSCSDATSGAASASVSQTVSSEGANGSATGTCTDNAGNTASDTQGSINIDLTAPTLNPAISPYPVRVGQSATANPNASDALSGIASQSCGALDTATPGSKTVSCTATDLAGNSASVNASYEVLAAIFPATGILDNFDRANGAVGNNWQGLTSTRFYRIASNKLDVQSGGPLLWKTRFGAAQEAFVTLSTIDPKSPSAGVLLKVQDSSRTEAGAISVAYDAVAKAVRVSTLRLGSNGAWTLYSAKSATFANGDVLGAQAKADGTVLIYKNGTLLATVTLNAADQAFFKAKGGKIGIWAAAPNALLDDFGGGSMP